MSRRHGPLPAWGWAVVAIGGLLLAFFVRSRSSQHADTAPAAQPVTGGSVGPNVAPAPSGLDPATEQLIAALAAGGAFAYGPGAATGSAGQTAVGMPCSGSTAHGDSCPPGFYCHNAKCKLMDHPQGGQSAHSVGGIGPAGADPAHGAVL